MKTAIIGCGGHARSVADILIQKNPNIEIIFFDENAQFGEMIMGEYKVCLPDALDMDAFDNYVIAMGDNKKRQAYANKLKRFEHKCISIVSQSVYIGELAKIGKGTVILDGAHIGPESIIGDFCIINTNAVIEHGCKIGDYSHISVNSVICGKSSIGRFNFIGACACIIDGISLSDNIVVGAGGTVIHNLNEPGVYVGIPARKR